MIHSFRSKPVQKLWENGELRHIQPPKVAQKVLLFLDLLNAATAMEGLTMPNLHALKGDRAGTFAVNVTANWRLTFEPVTVKEADETGQEKEVLQIQNVDYEDYH